MHYDIVCSTMKERVIDTEKLVEIRRRKMTRTELAAAVDRTEQTIYNLETGKVKVSDKLINRVCAVLGIEPHEIEIKSERKRRAS